MGQGWSLFCYWRVYYLPLIVLISIQFKILLYSFNVIGLISCKAPSRSLRSFASIHLTVPLVFLSPMKNRAFSHSSSQLWNVPPPDICNTNLNLLVILFLYPSCIILGFIVVNCPWVFWKMLTNKMQFVLKTKCYISQYKLSKTLLCNRTF